MSSSPSARHPSEADRDTVQTSLEEGPARGLAYAARLRTLLVAGSRYVAYTSDIGEAIRPIVTPAVVRAAYAVSWLYLGGDVGYAGWRTWQTSEAGPAAANTGANGSVGSAVSSALPEKDELRRRLANVQTTQDAKAAASDVASETSRALSAATSGGSVPAEVAFVMARRAVFQTLASMALPAFTIHSIVRYSAPLFARSASRRLASLGPTISGLACVPALPFIFDHPVEQAVDYVFDKIEDVVLPAASATEARRAKQAAAKEAKEGMTEVVEEAKKKV
ncbi:hypothetical protein CF319_g5499 [Tilletia indica]|uniref:Mitochondrial fission process protein 1 n=1 Tax=Tilletia indica TaxID=43049 RepID=A0A177TXB0_9BASI|nr:hypothetical protein CF319_g5499 [Tilletia indica]KAE8232893.1 hypothetical protein CF326_g2073 [Tilletia indica]KAE8244351.1 hypothetical protein A4X13_0g6658 [Tilletia indica]